METRLLDLECSVDEEVKRIRTEQEEAYKARAELLELFSKLLEKRLKKNFNKYNLYQKYKLFENIIRKEVKTEEDKKISLLAISAYHVASGLLNLRTRPLEQLNPSLVSSTSLAPFAPLESEVYGSEGVKGKLEKRSEEIELKGSLERVIKQVESERKLKKRYQKFQKLGLVKLIKQYDLETIGKLSSAISIAAEIAFFAFLFGKESINLYLTQRKITQTQQMCEEITNLRQIKKLFKGIECKTFAVGESEDLKPGTYNLLNFINYNKKDEIREYLQKTKIEIVQVRPLSYPFDGCRLGDTFGAHRKNIGVGGDHRHTGVDFNSNKDWNVKAAIEMKVIQTSYNKRGGYFVKGEMGQLKANNDTKSLEVILLNGQKFKINVDSLRCCIKQGFCNKFYEMPIEYFDGKNLYIVYCHLRKNSFKVKPGDCVKRGEVIGIKGKTGRAFSEHLHLELIICGKGESSMKIDPLPFFENEAIGNIDEFYAIVDFVNKILHKQP